MKNFDLEKRLVDFSVRILEIANTMSQSRAGLHLSGQLIRSGTSPALNYGEAQAAESRKDFIHKIKIILKELRESFVCLKIIHESKLSKSEENLSWALNECDELIAIFVKSSKTAKENLKKRK